MDWGGLAPVEGEKAPSFLDFWKGPAGVKNGGGARVKPFLTGVPLKGKRENSLLAGLILPGAWAFRNWGLTADLGALCLHTQLGSPGAHFLRGGVDKFPLLIPGGEGVEKGPRGAFFSGVCALAIGHHKFFSRANMCAAALTHAWEAFSLGGLLVSTPLFFGGDTGGFPLGDQLRGYSRGAPKRGGPQDLLWAQRSVPP